MSSHAYNSLNSFTQGGQFLRNFAVMAKQNILRTLLAGLFIGLFTGAINWHMNADTHSRYVLVNEIMMRTTSFLNEDADREITVADENGKRTLTTLKRRMEVSHYARDVAEMERHFGRAFFVGLSWAMGLIVLLFLIAARIGASLSRDKHVRGAKLTTPRTVEKQVARYNKVEAKKQGYQDHRSYLLAGLAYPFRAETQHTLMCGSTGSGKTQGIFEIVLQIYERGDRGVFYDKMRSFIEKMFDPSRDVLLNPLDKRCAAWDMFADARHIVDWEMIAQALIPNENPEYAFFETTARSVFAHVANRIQKDAKIAGRRPVMSELLTKLTATTDEELHSFLEGTPAQLNIDPSNPRTTGSIRSTVGNAIRSLGYLRDPEPGEKGFSIREWIADDDRASVVYLTSRDDMHPVLQPLLTMWIGIFTSALMSQERSSSRLIWFLLDELPSLNRLPNLEQALAEARQYGAAYLLGIQLVSQLRAIYGKDGADTILGLARTKMVFNPGDPITAETMAQFIGKQEITRKDHSMSVGATELRDGQSVSNRMTQELIVMPEELSTLPSLVAILSFTGDFPACRVQIEYKSLVGDNPGFLEDPDAIERNERAFDPRRKLTPARNEKNRTLRPESLEAETCPDNDRFVPDMSEQIGYPSNTIDVTTLGSHRSKSASSAEPKTAISEDPGPTAASGFRAQDLVKTITHAKPGSKQPSGSIRPILQHHEDDDDGEGGMDAAIGNDRIHLDMLAAEQEMQGQSPAVTKNGKDMRSEDREADTKRADEDYEQRREEERRNEEREAEALEKEQPAYRGHDLAPDHWAGR